MSCESEFRRSEVALDSNETVEEFRKTSRMSYSRDYLLSLASLNVAKELPSDFNRSVFSELVHSAPEHRKLPCLESPCSGRIPSDSSTGSSERWGSCKLRSYDAKSTDSGKLYSSQSRRSRQNSGSTAIVRSFPNPEYDGILGSWSASKLPSAGSKVSNPKLQGTDSCLLSRCKEPYRPPSFYKAMLHSGSQNHDTSSNETSGLSECLSKERAMEENWRKDTCLLTEENSAVPAITNKQDPLPICPVISESVESLCSAEEVSEKCHAEGIPHHQPPLPLQEPAVQQLPSENQFLTKDSEVAVDVEKFQEGGRFSALINLEEAEDIDTYFVDEANTSNDSSGDGQGVKEAILEHDILEKKELRSHVDYPFKSKETQIADLLHVNATGNTTNKSLAEDLLHVNAMQKTGSKLSAVEPSISSASSVGPSYRASLQSAFADHDWKGIDATSKDVHKVYSSLTVDSDHSHVREKSFNGFTPEIWQSSPCTKNYGYTVSDRSSSRTDSRFIPWFTDNGRTDCNISSGADKDGRTIWGASTAKSMTSDHLGQGTPKGQLTYDQKAPFSKKTKTGASDLLRSHCAVQNAFYPDGISYHSQNNQKPQLEKVARNQDLYRTSGDVSDFQIADEADNSLEFTLPDEDSLITVDDTYILEQDKPCRSSEFPFRSVRSTSPIPGSNKSKGSEIIQQNLNLPDPWSHESQSNSWSRSDFLAPEFSFTGARSTSPFPCSNKSMGSEIIQQNLSSPDPWFQGSQFNSWSHSDSLAHVNAPTTYNDPWKIHHNDHNPFAVVPSPSERLPMNLQNIEPSVEDFLLPRIPEADDCCPDLDKILSAEPSVYHQFFQTPCCNQELNMQRSLPLNHHTTVKSAINGGVRGLLAEDRNMSTISQYLQMRMKLAQMNIEAAEQRTHCKATSFLFR